MLDHLRQDFRYAVRTLSRSRVFLATSVLTLAVAVGLVTAVFAVFNAYVLRPFAIHDPSRVYQIAWRAPEGGDARFTWREYETLAGRADLFAGTAAHRWQRVSAGNRELQAAFVSGSYFETLRPRVALGRSLAPLDTQGPGASAVAVLSDHGWAVLFGRDPNVIGRRVDLNGRPFEIVGVVGPAFSGLDDSPLDLWVPLTMLPVVSGTDLFGASQPRELTIFARLGSAETRVTAEQSLTPLVREAAARAGWREQVRAELRPKATPNVLTVELVALLSPIFAAFGLVLVAASANVSSVMLARALSRQREIGIRVAVGASRGRLIRQLLTEAGVVGLLAALAGLALAKGLVIAGERLFFTSLPASLVDLARVVPLDLDLRVFFFAVGVGIVATFTSALVPALQVTRARFVGTLTGHPAAGFRIGTMRSLLVAGQVTVSLTLLIAASTLVRNNLTLAATDLGLDTRGVLSVNQRGESNALIASAGRALGADSRVASVVVTSRNPLFGQLDTVGLTAGMSDGSTATRTSYMFVSPDYFSLLRIPLVRGRAFLRSEGEAEDPVAIVSERTARTLWHDVDPIGQTVRVRADPNQATETLDGYTDLLVVGVARDVVSGLIYDGADAAIVYLPTSLTGRHAGALLLRGHAGTLGRDAVTRVLERVSEDRAAFEVIPLTEMSEIMLYPLRVASWIGAFLGAVALGLTIAGLYGLLMYILGQRTREIGIRMALGATAAAVVGLVMRQSARVVAIGAGVGLVIAFSVLKLLSSLVPFGNVSVLSGGSFTAGVALLIVAAGLSTWLPARRAARIDPNLALRAEN